MSAGAIVMMIIAIAVVWGGLIAAIIRLRRHPPVPEAPPPGVKPAE
ncbi:methionine/alanine import family NSS transporter small subunit [Streptomyces sp. NPDC057271]